MRVALADIPFPFLHERRVLASGSDGAWHDFAAVLGHAGIADAPCGRDLAPALSFLARLSGASRRRIERLLDESDDEIDAPDLVAPISGDAKLLLTEGSIALSHSNDQRPTRMVVGFSKFASAFAAPDAVIRLDSGARYDVEAVLAAVLGSGGNRLGGAAAARSIVGYTLLAEVTHRDMFDTEARTNNSLFAKNCPELSPCGPDIFVGGLAPATEITLVVNGTVRQRFTIGDFAHAIPDAVKAWSRVVLEPGDMVALGAAIARPKEGNDVGSPVPIAPGDRIEVACDAIGVLRARVAD